MATIPKVGVIGGGQLAQLMTIASDDLAIDLIVQARSNTDIAVPFSKHFLVGDDYSALIRTCSKITFENEFVDPQRLRSQGGLDEQFIPNLAVMELIIDKLRQCQHLQTHQLPIPKFYGVESDADMQQYANQLGFPCVLKSRQFGYDGKGTWIVNSLNELSEAWQKIGKVPIILTEFIAYTKELAVMVACDRYGEVIYYPIVETIQTNQVCDRVLFPADISKDLAKQIKEISQQVVKSFACAGIFGIELFLTSDRQIVINEIAPRTHNSGHYTIEVCTISQFKQLLRICAGLNAIPPQIIFPCAVMVNLLGYEDKIDEYLVQRSQIQQIPNTHLHWYGKAHSKVGRKLGHVTIVGDHFPSLQITADRVSEIWYPSC